MEEDGCIWTLFAVCNSRAERICAQDKEEGRRGGRGGGSKQASLSVPDVYAGGLCECHLSAVVLVQVNQ